MSSFRLKRRINYYETDAMGVVHHSNYLRYFEEARGAWFRDRGADEMTWVKGMGFPVVAADIQYKKPARFDETVDVAVQIRVEGVRIHFQYAVLKGDDVICTGNTTHVPIDENFKVVRLPENFLKILEKEPWTETWL